MSTFINMNAVLKIKPDAKATCNKIICDTIIESYHSVEDMADGQSLDDFYKTADVNYPSPEGNGLVTVQS